MTAAQRGLLLLIAHTALCALAVVLACEHGTGAGLAMVFATTTLSLAAVVFLELPLVREVHP